MNAPVAPTPMDLDRGQSQSQDRDQGLSISYRARLIQRAAPRVPVTLEGLPVGYYRADLLPLDPSFLDIATNDENKGSEGSEGKDENENENKGNSELEALRAAYIDLSFEQSYPTQVSGLPFWYKLDSEPGFAYGCFQVYLESIDEGPRELGRIAHSEELRHIAGRNSLPPRQSIDVQEMYAILYEYSILYHWRSRAKAHDLYKEAAYRHLRLRRQGTVEDDHYLLATKLLGELKEKVLGTPAFFSEMSPKVAVDLLAKLVAIQRVSVGLPAQGPLPNKEAPEDTTFEMIMRTIGLKAGSSSKEGIGGLGGNGGGGGIYDQSGAPVRQMLGRVLEDPQAAKQMQELVIRVTRAARERLPDPGSISARKFKGRAGVTRSSEIITTDDLTAPYDITGAPGENLDSLKEEGAQGSPESESGVRGVEAEK